MIRWMMTFAALALTAASGTSAKTLQYVGDDSPAWTVLSKTFSAITIGIAFEDDKTGWTSHTDGSSAIQIVKTEDGGQTWANVKNNTGLHLIMLGLAAAKKGQLPITNVATTGVGASEYSLNGDTFKTSIVETLDSQDIDFAPNGLTGQMTIAGTNGPCVSHTGGALYECHKIPLKQKGTARYVASPSKDVLYVSAGKWPQAPSPTPTTVRHVTRNIHVDTDSNKILHLGSWSEYTGEVGNETGGYLAELWKSTDGGKNWTNLLSDEGAFYFNDIDCFDETHCVAVGEGFPQDGSTSPGARIYVTSDGETFDLVYTSNTTGGDSLMAAAMLSTTEIWVGGTAKTGGLLAPCFALHSTDGGKTWTNENNGIIGQMITALDFVSSTHAYATTVNALQVSSLLEYVSGGPAPAPTPGPSPGQTHYGDPNAGPCESDEVPIQIQGIDGSICTPACDSSGACPTDVPAGVTATPQCALKSSTGDQYCALICTPSGLSFVDANQCGDKASCKPISGTGLCTYDS